jgi:hypothetical protein
MGDMDYFGVRQPCGCITAWISADHSTEREIREFYAEMAKTGREVRRAPLDGPDGLRWQMSSCEHKDAA